MTESVEAQLTRMENPVAKVAAQIDDTDIDAITTSLGNNLTINEEETKREATKRLQKRLATNGGISKFMPYYHIPEINEKLSGIIELLPDILIPKGPTNGASDFRKGGTWGKWKMFRFQKNTTRNNMISSANWELEPSEADKILEDHARLTVIGIWPRSSGIQYIKFYGIIEKPVANVSIRPDIVQHFNQQNCVFCDRGPSQAIIECDHKNSKWKHNDQRYGSHATQLITMFQATCKHCNVKKREIDVKTEISGKRQPPPPSKGYTQDFTQGDDTFDIKDPNWWVGTYYGDPVAFTQAFTLKNNDYETKYNELKEELTKLLEK